MKLNKGWSLIVKLVAPKRGRKLQKKIKNEIQTVQGAHYVSNTVGSSGDKGSKKAYWEKATGSKFSSCQISKCKNPATVGGHVWIKGFQSSEVVYILPLCQVGIDQVLKYFFDSTYNIFRSVTRTGVWTIHIARRARDLRFLLADHQPSVLYLSIVRDNL